MIARMVYVMCNACGTPATGPVDDGAEARRLVPLEWTRPVAANGRREDLCPSCSAALAPNPTDEEK